MSARGCLPGVSVQGDVYPGGLFAQGGCLAGEVCPGGVYSKGGGGCVCLEGCLPPGVYTTLLWTEFLTHVCENIVFLQLLLWTVKMALAIKFVKLRIVSRSRF